MIKGGRVERSVKMRKQNALIAGTVVIASVLALAQSANAQGYYQPVPGGYYYPPGPGYPRPAPAFLPPVYGPPPVLPPVYGSPPPYYPQQVPQQPPDQGRGQMVGTSNGWPQFPTWSEDQQDLNDAWEHGGKQFCQIFCY